MNILHNQLRYLINLCLTSSFSIIFFIIIYLSKQFCIMFVVCFFFVFKPQAPVELIVLRLLCCFSCDTSSDLVYQSVLMCPVQFLVMVGFVFFFFLSFFSFFFSFFQWNFSGFGSQHFKLSL